MPLLPLFGPLMTLAWPFARKRLARGHEVGLEERLGYYSAEKQAALDGDRNFWLHAVSVGEVQAASAFVDAMSIAPRGCNVVLSTVTVTGARNASLLIGGDAFAPMAHVYAPWDVPAIVRRACDAICPAAYATIETEIWPNILLELRRRNVPRFLLGARVSDRMWKKRGLARRVLGEMYRLFDAIYARSDADAERLVALGADAANVLVAGDFKIDAILKRRDEASSQADALNTLLTGGGERTVFVAGSTHEGEDEILLDAFSETAGENILAIAPRHPERAVEVAALAADRGFDAVLLSELKRRDVAGYSNVVIVDEIGVLYGLYGVAASAFIGGSLVPKGGQNILEPASWGIPVLHGPHMDDFAEATTELDASLAAFEVRTAGEIAEHWRRATEPSALSEPVDLARIAYFSRNVGAARRAWRYMGRFLL